MQSDLQHILWLAWNAGTRVSKAIGVIALLWISSIEAETAQVGRDYLLPTQAKGGFIFSPSSTESNQPSSTESNQSNSTKASTISYKAFDGSTHQLVENRGRYVNVLIPQSYDEGPFFTADHIEEMVDRLDMLYALYTELMQGQPDGNGLLNIAFVPQTCGMGCGLIGTKGIEVLSVQHSYEAIIRELDAGRLESVLLHEMAHNFDAFSSYLYYLPDHAHAWTDMFEFFAPFRYARLNSHDQTPDDVYNSPVSAIWKKYVSEESATWERCVINDACTDLGLTANNLWAMLYYRIDAIHGIEALLGSFEFLREYVKTRHPPTSDEGKEGLRILSLAMGAGVNISCYMDALKWPIPANIKSELINTFGNNNPLCADKDGDGFSTINGDCDDALASRNIMATEIRGNNIDDDCDDIVDEAHLVEKDAGVEDDNFKNPMQSQLPFQVDGSSTSLDDRDSFVFHLPPSGRTRVTLCASNGFKGWITATLANGSFLEGVNWYSYQPGPGCTSNTFDFGNITSAGLVVIPDESVGDYSLDVTAADELLPDHSAFLQVSSNPNGGMDLNLNDSNGLFSNLAADEIEIWISGVGVQLLEPFAGNQTIRLDTISAPELQDGEIYLARMQPRADGRPLAAFSAGQPFRYDLNTAKLPTIDHRFSGAWFDSTHDGEGFIIEVLDETRAVIYWFTYQDDGSQRWMLGVGEVSGNQITVSNLMDSHGGRFGESFNPDDVVLSNVGSISLSFLDCSRALVSYSVDNNGAHQDTSRLTNVYGHHCDNETPLPDKDISGSWYDPSHNGEGFVVEQLDAERALVFWFTYDESGEQSWMFNTGTFEEGSIHIPQLLQPVGGQFGRSYDPASVRKDEWGELILDLNCAGGTANYTTQTQGYSSGSQALQPVTRLAASNCAD